MNHYKNQLIILLKKDIAYFLFIGLAILISIFHYTTAEYMDGLYFFVHILLRKMYFIPVLLAAFWGGRKASIITLIFVTILFLPHAIFQWPSTLTAGFDNASEIALLWIIGGLSGTLSDKLKGYTSEKIRYSTLESISNILSLINSEIMVDYKASLGSATALQKSIPNTNGSYLTAMVLLNRLEHLGSHLKNLEDLVLPEPYEKRKINITKLLVECVDINNQRFPNIDIKYIFSGKIPHLYLDEKRVRFAISIIIQSIVQNDNSLKNLNILVGKKLRSIIIRYESINSSDNREPKKWNLFDLYSNPEAGYALSLALSIIRSHGGNFEIDNYREKNALTLYFPISLGRGLFN
jgi:hypothetical protein